MSNLHHRIANNRPISHDEKHVLDIYMLLAVILFGRPLSIESVEFIVTLMRLNGIAQKSRINIQTNVTKPIDTGMNVAMYHQHVQNSIGSMMR
jgi:hypothetical protein